MRTVSPTSKFANIKSESPKGPAKSSLPVKNSLPLKRSDSFKGHAKEPSNPRSSTQLIVMLLGLAALAFILFGPSTSPQPSAGHGYSRGILGGRTWHRAARLAINYADRCCATSQPKSCANMLEHGAHKCIQYNATALDEGFKIRNAKILAQVREGVNGRQAPQSTTGCHCDFHCSPCFAVPLCLCCSRTT